VKLAAGADVVLENFRPGVMSRLDVGFERLRGANPSLVYCAISGFGQDGPLAANPAYDQIIQGLSGVMSLTGVENQEPYRVGYPICDTLGGLTAAFAICAALVRRKTSGEGQFIDVSLLDSTLVSLGWPLSNMLIAGVEPRRLGNDNATASPSGAFRTGRGLLNIAANKQEQFLALCTVLGIAEVADDDRFSRPEARKRNRTMMTAVIEDALAGNTAEHWSTVLNAAGVPAGCVLDLGDAVRQPQVMHRRLIETVTVDADPATLHLLRAGFQTNGEPATISAPPPKLGEHTDGVLAELGYDADAIEALRTAGAI
jgi:formyl-CoA transferase